VNWASSQAWYDNTSRSPGGSTLVLAGGLDVPHELRRRGLAVTPGTWATTASFRRRTGAVDYVHADSHWITFDPRTESRLHCVRRGIFKSTDAGVNWPPRTTARTSQFYAGLFSS
jgi:hypothetical protein